MIPVLQKIAEILVVTFASLMALEFFVAQELPPLATLCGALIIPVGWMAFTYDRRQADQQTETGRDA